MKKLLFIALTTMSLTGCHVYKHSLGHYKLPTVDIKPGAKVGKVCSDENLDPFEGATDLTVETARKRGGIKEITNIEQETSRVFIFYKTCVVVYGN
jgi:hypothetical protein